MTKKKWFISIAIGVFVGLIGGVLGLSQWLQVRSGQASSSVDEALALTLTSHLQWETIQGEAEITWYGSDGEEQAYLNTFVIEQPNKARIGVKSLDDSSVDSEWISDGENTYEIDLQEKTYTQATLPASSEDLSMLLSTLEDAKTTNIIYNHPFGMLISAPVKEYLFPQWFSQGGGEYDLIGEDTLLGRKVWMVQHTKNTNDVTAWIDEETGIILKYSQTQNGNPVVEVIFSEFEVDAAVDTSNFVLPSDVIVR